MLRNQRSMLVVDDDTAILNTFSRILKRNGYRVVTAQNGSEAKALLQQDSFDVSLVDMRLPDMNGVDLLPAMQQTAPSMVRIVLTGMASDENEALAAEKGADLFLAKPVQPEFLLRLLEELPLRVKTHS